MYCSFYSIESFAQKDRFLAALLNEIDMTAASPGGAELCEEEVHTIFFGGGTPSMLSPQEIGAILGKLGEHFRIHPDAEITMECNPGALEREWLQGYREAGINRLSFGVQSFHDDELQFLSRIHSAAEAEENIRLVRDVFDNVSLDLIFALPNQTPERWRHNLERAVALGTDHISAYALIFEEGTPLNAARLKGAVAPASTDMEADMFEETVSFLADHGLRQYETSNYAKDGYECHHNVGYWERRSYISFGPSSHSYKRRGVLGERWANVSSLTAYLGTVESGELPVISRETLTSVTAMEEIVMLGLRCKGIDMDDFHAATGSPLSEIAADPVRRMLNDGYAKIAENRLKLTPKGTIFADRFALEIIDATVRELQPSSP